MLHLKRIIAIILTITLVLCSGSVAFADDPSTESTEVVAPVSELAEETESVAVESVQEDEQEIETTTLPELPEASEAVETPAAQTPEVSGIKEDAVQEYDGDTDIEIVSTDSPVEASQAAPAADNNAFYTVDLNNGKVTDQSDNNVANGFAEIYGEKYSETGLKEMSDSQKEEQIVDMTAETELSEHSIRFLFP